MPIAMKAPYASAIYANGELDGPQIGTLVVVVDKGRNLPNRRTMGKQDPYFNARLGKEAKKTNADKRGGQTPKWDQELRFNVHDSPDYYTMKVSLFDEGKRTELIGDAWVDLKAVIVPGGGEAEIWQELKCKEKYAGEVRLEFTYYDSRPKIEKPIPKKQSSRIFDEEHSPAGSARGRTPVKRRPLPSNPGSVEQSRSFASGPREYGSAVQPRSADLIPASQRRNIHNNNMPQPIQRAPRGDQQQAAYLAHDQYEEHDPFVHDNEHHNDYALQQPYTHEHDGIQPNDIWNHGHNSNESGYHAYEYDQPHDTSGFLPQLPPMNKNGSTESGRNSRSRQHHDSAQQSHPREDFRFASATADTEYRSASNKGWHSQSFGHGDDYQSQSMHDPPNQYIDPRLIMANTYDHEPDHEEFQFEHQNEYDQFNHQADEELPPPPPMHRASVSNEAVPSRRSSATIEHHEQNWSLQHVRQGSMYSNSSRKSSSRTPGDSRSPSALSLSTYNAAYDDRSAAEYPQSTMIPYRERHDSTVRSHRSLSEEPMQTYGFDQASPQSPYFHSLQSSPTKNEMPHTPRSAGSFSQDCYGGSPGDRRNSYHSNSLPDSHSRMAHRQAQQVQTYPQSQQSPLASSPIYPHHSRNGSLSHSQNHSPSKPHPLSQQQDILSSSPHSYHQEQSTFRSSYDPSMPLIKPLAIGQRKSQPTTPSSVERHARTPNRSTIPRKSVSPHPASADGKPHFSAFSPESYNVLNPGPSPAKQRVVDPSAPIVDFHGNVIDPSDRLPETSWAPEPTKPVARGSDDHLPSSTWAAEHRGAEPRRITVRTRDVPRGTRGSQNTSQSPSSLNNSYNARSTPDNRASMYITSPQSVISPTDISPSTTPHTRNRLRKLNRPHSMVSVSSSPMHQPQHSWTPPIPAKIPLDDQRGMVPYSSGPNMDRLNFELQNIDIGSNSEARRIGGRRLLEYNS